MDNEVTEKLESWFIMLNTDEFNGTDVEIVRQEIKQVLLKRYCSKLGTTFN